MAPPVATPPVKTRETRSFGKPLRVALALLLATASPLVSDDRAPAEQGSPVSETGAGSAGHPLETDSPTRRKEALTLGFIMLGSIIIGGTILLALVVMWGNRTRRLARSPLPPVAERDELWFLKPKKGSEIQETDTGKSGDPVEPGGE
jgi:hypothetical protein